MPTKNAEETVLSGAEWAGVYRFAGRCFRIRSVHRDIHTLCRDYRTDEPPEDEVCTDQAAIDAERLRSDRTERDAPHPPYSDAYLETLAVYRQIAEKLPACGTFLFHGSAIAADGQAYIFTASSGTGKSTHARLWRQLLGGRALMINDDKPLVQVHPDGSATVHGTPWDGKHHLSSSTAAPLRAICLLERSAENQIREISKAEALPRLLQQAYRPADPAALAQTLNLIDRLNVRLYRLGCNMDISAAELSWSAMRAEEA